MITKDLYLVWTLIWALVVGNLIAVAFLLFIMRWVALLTFVNGAMLVPFIMVLAVIGASDDDRVRWIGESDFQSTDVAIDL